MTPFRGPKSGLWVTSMYYACASARVRSTVVSFQGQACRRQVHTGHDSCLSFKSGPNLAARSGLEDTSGWQCRGKCLRCPRWEPGKGTTAAICGFVTTIGAFPSQPLRRHGNMRAISPEDWIANREARAGRWRQWAYWSDSPMLPSLAGLSRVGRDAKGASQGEHHG